MAMKLSPFFSAMPNMARKLDRHGADGLVLFNRFYQPDFDLEELRSCPNLVLSTSGIDAAAAALGGDPVRSRQGLDGADDAASTRPRTCVKAVMTGADVAQLCVVSCENGIGQISDRAGGMEPGWKSTSTTRSPR